MVRVRLSVAERREELLRAAIEQIEARGVAAVRIADVASALGVSNALVLYHFSTKEKLVAAAFTYAAEGDLAHLRKLLGRRTTALRRLRAAVRWYAPTGQAKGWRLWIEGWAAALREPALQEVTRDLDRRWKAAIAEVIAEGVAAGEFHCPDPGGTALRLTAMLDGLAVQLTSYAGAVSRSRAQDWVDEALARELGLEPARGIRSREIGGAAQPR
ncbi:TetR/AcrR family transcriptional regulator [Streptomyces sp. NL15-2K]|uniref:TetR/AcrR family transcriptional regulator n=1 Tax=Streptomyces sp. NL15-2K TaxID=376149 RepID=UPI000FFAA601|nr:MULTISPECIES: TetR family transcriptional regulator C-terminal domain-containing protein [Actinomycetes]WKX14687.1 TetR family transcriptional regulator C-terminal domain-containing protein [Kutzneria buriramensis]GCB44169.1 tetR family transcriptional regulator [Streptomyces sp. NL15-2K]